MKNRERSFDSDYLSSPEFHIAKVAALPPKRTSRRLVSFIRAINVTFILVASVSIIGSPVLGNILNMHIGVSSYSYSEANIHRGDLLILKNKRLSRISVGNVVLVHRFAGVSSNLQLGSITSHPNPKLVDISVMGPSYKLGATETYAWGTEIQVVTRVFPKLGMIMNFFESNLVRVGFLFLVAIVNLFLYVSSRRAAYRAKVLGTPASRARTHYPKRGLPRDAQNPRPTAHSWWFHEGIFTLCTSPQDHSG